MDGYGLRMMRAAVFAALSVLLSSGVRLVVTGQPLPVDTVLIAFAGSLGAAILLTAAERGFWCIAAVLVPLQMSLNALFNAGQQSCPPGTGTGVGVGVSGWPGVLACGGGSIRPGLIGATAGVPRALVSLTTGQVVLLLALHLLLALATAWWLRRGEAAIHRTLHAVAAFARGPLRSLLLFLVAPLPRATPVLPPTPRRSQPGPQDVRVRTARRRGPPACAPAC
ncbi:hypothetical protein [Streptacidiphilus sp. PAMC 29251]